MQNNRNIVLENIGGKIQKIGVKKSVLKNYPIRTYKPTVHTLILANQSYDLCQFQMFLILKMH